MSTVRILAGNVARSSFLPVTDDNSVVDIANVTVRLDPPAGYDGYDADDLDLDGNINLTDDIVENGDNDFHVDWVIPDNMGRGITGVFHWESRAPSAHITYENQFRTAAALITNP